MERSDEVENASPAEEPFPTTHSTLKKPGQRATLDDHRLHDRSVGSSLEDQEIAGRILFALAEDGRVNLGDGLNDRISVKSEGHVATITGIVGCAGERMAVEELVASVPGVEIVEDALTVSIDQYLDDEDLSRHVRERLDGEGLAWAGFRVTKGIVRMMGTAEKLADAEHARRVAAGVKGVRDVVNNIKIRMPDYTDDLDLLSLVTQGLSLQDLLVLDREVRVANGVVEITGKVRPLADRRRVRRLIGEIAGVRDIKDHLQVDPALFRNLEARRQNSTGR